jgi:hypothetical protein
VAVDAHQLQHRAVPVSDTHVNDGAANVALHWGAVCLISFPSCSRLDSMDSLPGQLIHNLGVDLQTVSFSERGRTLVAC